MSLYIHCVRNSRKNLLKQWDAEKNAPLTPKSIAATSTARVWWKCEKGHSWQTQLSSRVRGNSGCPACLREKIDVRMEKRRAAEAEKKQDYHKKSHIGGKEE
ncbi:MAG TPA: zinc-ribbon domain-containing protein [Syntrophomonas sp.]|nr:zinc-ribbon domain-containing protein [Syntrophomonas sp.]